MMNFSSRRISAALTVLCVVCAAALAQSSPSNSPKSFTGEAIKLPDVLPAKFEAVADAAQLPESSWVRFFTTDELSRVIVFYVSESSLNQAAAGAPKLPVIVYVQGSGSQSIYTRIERDGAVIASASGGQESVAQFAKGRAMVVIAEKPGVSFMERPERPGGAEGSSQDFRVEHTLERWSVAVAAAMKAALTLSRADATRVMVEGHSEGGLVACKVAADNTEVTHVATLAGGGATQLFDLVELARSGVMCGSKSRSSEACVQWLLAQWGEVLKNPDSADEMFLGHPHRRWTSFLATSPVEELKRTKARLFIGQGTEDKSAFPTSADVLYATMRATGRTVTYSRVPGDHAFMTAMPGDEKNVDPAGWDQMHSRVVEWFLAE